MKRPPPFAEYLMRVLLPQEAFEAIAGDLEEAWHAGALGAAQYWRLALTSIAQVHGERLRTAEGRGPFTTDPERHGDGPMRSLIQDLGYGFRLLRRAPGFTLAAVATLALGIGANTAIFSLVNILALRPLPYRDPARVAFVLAWDLERQANRFSMSLADVAELQRQTRTLQDMAAYSYWSANLTSGDVPERVQAYEVTANTFNLLGVPPLLGRALRPEDGAEGSRDVVVISHGLWERRFGGDASVVGSELQVDGRARTIVGVMPAAFEFPVFNFKGDLWAPMSFDPAAVLANRSAAPRATTLARVRGGVSYAEAQAEIDTLMRQIEEEQPVTNRALSARLLEMGKLDDEIAGTGMSIVIATAAVVLLLACANVANLLLARGAARHRELAVRAALGARRGRIVRQLLVESLLLAIAGGLAGSALAFVALEGLRSSLPEAVLMTQPNILALGIDRNTLAFALVLSLFTSLLCGLVPAWKASRPYLQEGLKESASAGGAAGTRKLRTALVVAEVALSTMLLVGATLLVRSYQNLRQVTPGFNPDGVLTLAVTLPDYRYGTEERIRQFYEEATDRIARVPSVERAAFVNVLPFSTYDRGSRFLIDGRPLPEAGREPSAGFRSITPGYFDTLHIPLLSGRAFAASDRPGSLPVGIVNREFARQNFDGQDPVGQRIKNAGSDTAAPWITVVGVVGDVHHTQLTTRPAPEVYRPFAQAPRAMMMLAARVNGDPVALAPAVRKAIQAIDPTQPVFHVKTLDALVSESLAAQTAAASLVALFSALALVLATIGTYGVVSYAVSQQTREFGVRMAFGATPGHVVRLVMRQGFLLVVVGVGLGLAGAAAVTRLLAGALYGIGPGDPLAFTGVGAVLLIVGLGACAVPAIRATRIEPVRALRME
jgi:putative ABC transport system permease protein